MARNGFLNVLWVLQSAQLSAELQIEAQQLIISGIVVQHHGQNLSSSSSSSSQAVFYFSGLPPDFLPSRSLQLPHWGLGSTQTCLFPGSLHKDPEATPYQVGEEGSLKDGASEHLLCLEWDHFSHVVQPEPQAPTSLRAADTLLNNAEIGLWSWDYRLAEHLGQCWNSLGWLGWEDLWHERR